MKYLILFLLLMFVAALGAWYFRSPHQSSREAMTVIDFVNVKNGTTDLFTDVFLRSGDMEDEIGHLGPGAIATLHEHLIFPSRHLRVEWRSPDGRQHSSDVLMSEQNGGEISILILQNDAFIVPNSRPAFNGDQHTDQTN
ncbi:MAG: hypothetical protein GC162_00265 [Planctomycetes bacterium]|nr:hypothetical protein [Planctomycetota bacterium]